MDVSQDFTDSPRRCLELLTTDDRRRGNKLTNEPSAQLS